MKALSIIQPWATLICLGEKEFETRDWQTTHKGTLGIHASKKQTQELREICETPLIQRLLMKHGLTFETMPRGCLIGQAELVGCLPTNQFGPNDLTPQENALGNWQCGRFAWRFTNAQRWKKPLPCAGRLSIFSIDDGVIAAFHAAQQAVA